MRRRGRGPLLRGDHRHGGRFGFEDRLSLRRRLGFGHGSIFEEVFTQGGFEIGYEFTDDRSLGHAERCGRGLADRLKFRLDDVLGSRC